MLEIKDVNSALDILIIKIQNNLDKPIYTSHINLKPKQQWITLEILSNNKQRKTNMKEEKSHDIKLQKDYKSYEKS